ncbi:hypothetical protein Btru_041091 [Bulinus truncatus]|nr:hypothetical protein Btru_041091 [Bulinus truncatus]
MFLVIFCLKICILIVKCFEQVNILETDSVTFVCPQTVSSMRLYADRLGGHREWLAEFTPEDCATFRNMKCSRNSIQRIVTVPVTAYSRNIVSHSCGDNHTYEVHFYALPENIQCGIPELNILAELRPELDTSCLKGPNVVRGYIKAGTVVICSCRIQRNSGIFGRVYWATGSTSDEIILSNDYSANLTLTFPNDHNMTYSCKLAPELQKNNEITINPVLAYGPTKLYLTKSKIKLDMCSNTTITCSALSGEAHPGVNFEWISEDRNALLVQQGKSTSNLSSTVTVTAKLPGKYILTCRGENIIFPESYSEIYTVIVVELSNSAEPEINLKKENFLRESSEFEEVNVTCQANVKYGHFNLTVQAFNEYDDKIMTYTMIKVTVSDLAMKNPVLLVNNGHIVPEGETADNVNITCTSQESDVSMVMLSCLETNVTSYGTNVTIYKNITRLNNGDICVCEVHYNSSCDYIGKTAVLINVAYQAEISNFTANNLTSIEVTEGDNVTLACIVDSSPKPFINLQSSSRNNTYFRHKFNSNVTAISSNVSGSYVELKNINCRQSSVYECLAWNPIFSQETLKTVTVSGRCGVQLLDPSKNNTEFKGELGGLGAVTIDLLGFPEPKSFTLFEGSDKKPVDLNSFSYIYKRSTFFLGTMILIIDKLTEDNFTTYIVNVSNDIGPDLSFGFTLVKDVKPFDMEMIIIICTTVTVAVVIILIIVILVCRYNRRDTSSTTKSNSRNDKRNKEKQLNEQTSEEEEKMILGSSREQNRYKIGSKRNSNSRNDKIDEEAHLHKQTSEETSSNLTTTLPTSGSYLKDHYDQVDEEAVLENLITKNSNTERKEDGYLAPKVNRKKGGNKRRKNTNTKKTSEVNYENTNFINQKGNLSGKYLELQWDNTSDDGNFMDNIATEPTEHINAEGVELNKENEQYDPPFHEGDESPVENEQTETSSQEDVGLSNAPEINVSLADKNYREPQKETSLNVMNPSDIPPTPPENSEETAPKTLEPTTCNEKKKPPIRYTPMTVDKNQVSISPNEN